jgi:bacterioferritin
MAERWQGQSTTPEEGGQHYQGRRGGNGEPAETGATGRGTRGAGQARGQASTGGAARAGAPVWQSRLNQMLQDAEQNLSDGALTAGYKADPREVVALLQRAQAGEWASFLQYWHHYFMSSDMNSQEVKKVFKEHAEEEYEHARKIGDRIQQLGGVPCDSPEEIQRLTPTPTEYNHDVRSMLEADLIGERQTIDFYDEIIRTCGFDDNVTRRLFEHLVSDEAEHADDFATLLYAFDGSTGKEIESMHDELVRLAKGSQERGQVRRTA